MRPFGATTLSFPRWRIHRSPIESNTASKGDTSEALTASPPSPEPLSPPLPAYVEITPEGVTLRIRLAA